MSQDFLNKIQNDLLKHLESENEHVHFVSLIYGILSQIENNHPEFNVHLNIIKSIELLKASTLIIDDIIDNSNLRNNSKSFVSKFGVNNSILIGEALKSHATISFIENINRLSIDNQSKIDCILSFEDGFRTVSHGQLLDINTLTFHPDINNWNIEKWNAFQKDYFKIIYKTTSIFLQIPFFVVYHQKGYIPEKEFNLYHSYFKDMGIAYQVRDDIIDAVGLQEDIGREQGGDINERKIRLPLINFYKNCKDKKIKDNITELLNKKGDLSRNDLDYIIKILYDSDAIKLSIKTLNKICDNAISSINKIEHNIHKQELIDLVTFLKL